MIAQELKELYEVYCFSGCFFLAEKNTQLTLTFNI